MSKKITNDTEFTEHFLRMISEHLSGRPECKQIEYHVEILSDSNISISPREYQVFPNRYSKQEATKSSVIFHVLTCHCYPEAQHFSLVPGQYVYKLSVNRKQRRWHRCSNE